MDDEFDQAARRQREKKRLGALQAQQRLRRDAEKKEEAQAGKAAVASSPSVSSRSAMNTTTGVAGTAAEATAASASSPCLASGTSSSSSAPATGTASSPGADAARSGTSSGTSSPEVFKATIAAKFAELVASGMSKTQAASQAIRLVREAGLGLPPSASAGSASSSSGAPSQKMPKVSHELNRRCPDEDEERISPGDPFLCFICIEEKQPEDRFLPHRCTVVPENLCCRPCYVEWVKSQIDAEAAEIKCCHCDLLLQTKTLARLLDAEHWEKYCGIMLQRTLKRDASFIWCSKCSGGGWVDPTQPMSKCAWVCPECSNSFLYCPFCRREHGTLTCKRFQSLRYEILEGKAARERESEGVVQRSSKMCPSCKMPIQKEGGCNFMDCPNCRRHFCWSCGRVLKGSHQKHQCDAGFEGSEVVSRTPNGSPCVEFTRLFANVLDIDNVELLNADEADLAHLKDMLAPGLATAARSPLFVGPSKCDGEVMLRIPFNFQKSLAWEITHIQFRASHPPAPNSVPPRSITLLPNVTSASFSDFDDPSAPHVVLQDKGNGVFVAPLEHYRVKGTFRRVTSIAVRISSTIPAGDRFSIDGDDSDTELNDVKEVFLNDIAFFGVPSERGGGSARTSSMWDDRANLIVSPMIYKRRWGEEAAKAGPDHEDELAGQEGEEDAPAAAAGALQ